MPAGAAHRSQYVATQFVGQPREVGTIEGPQRRRIVLGDRCHGTVVTGPHRVTGGEDGNRRAVDGGRGTVATGRIERGVVKVGEEVALVGFGATKKTVVTGVEMFRKLLDSGMAGDNVGLLLRGVDRKDIERGQVIAKPNSIKPHTKFKAEVYVLSKEEGGRHTPFFTGYRPQFYLRTTDVTGIITLPEGVEMVMPGDNITITVELINKVAMEKGLRFAIREGGRTVGSGVVAKILK